MRDENQDFELNTRGIFGGRGFITTNTDVNGDGITPDSDPNVRNFGPASSDRAHAAGGHHHLHRARHPQRHRAAQRPAAIRRAAATSSAPPRPPAPTASPATAAPSGRPAASPTIRSTSTRCRAPIPASSTPPDPGSVFLNGFNSAAGAGRVCEVPPPPGCDRAPPHRAPGRHLHRHQPDRGAQQRHQPGQHRWRRRSTVAAAFGGDGFNTPSLLGIFDSAPYFRHGAPQRSKQVFGIGTGRTSCRGAGALARRHRRRGEHPRHAMPSAVTDLIAFVRTHRRRHADVRGRRPGAERSGLRRRGRALRLPEGSAARHPGARLRRNRSDPVGPPPVSPGRAL